MTQYEACMAIAELLKSFPNIGQLPIGSPVRVNYGSLLVKLFAIAG